MYNIVIKVNVTIYQSAHFLYTKYYFSLWSHGLHTILKQTKKLQKKTILANKTPTCLRKCIWGAAYIIAGLASIGSYRWINAPFLQGFAHKCWVDHWGGVLHRAVYTQDLSSFFSLLEYLQRILQRGNSYTR